MRIIALVSVLLLLGGGAPCLHHDEHQDVEHDCPLCTSQAPVLFLGVQTAPSARSTAVCSLLPGPQGPPLWALYRGCLLSRAPPAAA